MTSKEAFIKLTEYMVNIFNQRIDKNLAKDYFYNKDINFSINEFPIYKILEDLEDYEELKKTMGTPIQDIMKRLKILDIIKKWSFLDTFYREDTDTTYDRFLCNIHTKGMKEDFEKVKEWLNGKD